MDKDQDKFIELDLDNDLDQDDDLNQELDQDLDNDDLDKKDDKGSLFLINIFIIIT